MIELAIIALLTIKHLIVDFFLQTPYQWMNKGKYGHPGGILHSGLHAVTTALCIAVYVWDYKLVIGLALFDFAVHYHTDWAKVNINQKMQWKPDTHPEFWYLLGIDQFVHSVTYIVIVAALVVAKAI